MKQIIFIIYLYYHKYIPIERGKYTLGRLLRFFFNSFTVKLGNIYLEIIPSSMMDISYFYSGNESHKIIKNEIDLLNENSIFVDIGANIGYFSFLAAKRITGHGQIYAFEPSMREYKRLITGVLRNKIPNILIFNQALGASKDVIKFNIMPDKHTGINSILEQVKGGAFLVNIDSLDNIYNQKRAIDLIKIDIEGYEMFALMGMQNLFSKKLIKKVVIEITPHLLEKSGYSKNHLYEFMKNNGFDYKFNLETWQYDEVFTLAKN